MRRMGRTRALAWRICIRLIRMQCFLSFVKRLKMRDVASIGLLKLEKLTTGIHPCWDQWLDVLARKSAMSNKGIILEIPAFATDIPPIAPSRTQLLYRQTADGTPRRLRPDQSLTRQRVHLSVKFCCWEGR